MENVREVGGSLVFVVLRDFYGTTQLVTEDAALIAELKALNKESTIAAEGVVRERSSKNPKLPTGDIEIELTKIEVLGRCRYNELPFEINRSRDADEDGRLKYRYLDLRNPAVKKNIILRCNVVAALRQAMTEHGFLEITTPILTASSPEGARDYLVPARKHPGKFYALPQAPQQFKQLLMTSGFDRYFQIAPCFRDEDARGDRTPGEFYQMDMEMAFASQDDVLAVLEKVLPPSSPSTASITATSGSLPPHPLPGGHGELRHRQARSAYRPGIAGCHRAAQAAALAPSRETTKIKAVVVSDFALTRKQIDKLCTDVEVQAGQKPYWFRVDENGEIVGGIAKFVQSVRISDRRLWSEARLLCGLTAGKLPWPRRPPACCGPNWAPCARAIWTRSSTSSAGSWTSPCTRSARSPASWSSATIPSPCPTAAWRFWKGGAGEIDPLTITAFQYDLVCNGYESASGAVRNHDPEIMVKAFELVRLGEEDVKKKFPAMYNAFTYGAPPHAGAAPGVDRMIMLLTGEESIREVITFPMNQKAQDVMMDAPTTVTQKQLDELHIATALEGRRKA